MLQTQFTARITQIAPGLKRQSAYRFAPDLAKEPAPMTLGKPGNMLAPVNRRSRQ